MTCTKIVYLLMLGDFWTRSFLKYTRRARSIELESLIIWDAVFSLCLKTTRTVDLQVENLFPFTVSQSIICKQLLIIR